MIPFVRFAASLVSETNQALRDIGALLTDGAVRTTYEDMFEQPDQPVLNDALTGHEEQPAPVPNDGPSCHDLVIRDIASRDVRWDLSVGRARYLRDAVIDDLDKRKELGYRRYGAFLQAHNGRDFLRDLYEELQDAAVYARGRLMELDEDTLEYLILFEVYDNIVGDLVRVKRLRVSAATE